MKFSKEFKGNQKNLKVIENENCYHYIGRSDNLKTIFVYSSLSGNTKRLAYGLHKLCETPSEVINIDDYEEALADLYVLCSWIDKGKPDKKSLEIVDNFQGKNVYLIATLGASPKSEHGKECIKNMGEIYSNCNILGIDLVQGSISDQVIEMFKKLPADHLHALSEEKMKKYDSIKGRPNSKDFNEAFAKLKTKLRW